MPLEQPNITDIPPIEQTGPIDVPSENVIVEMAIGSEAEQEYDVTCFISERVIIPERVTPPSFSTHQHFFRDASTTQRAEVL